MGRADTRGQRRHRRRHGGTAPGGQAHRVPVAVTAGLQLGAPGVYPAPAEQPAPDLVSVRLDIAGFAGIAPRGPVDQPVTVTSWSEYVRDFGGFHPPCP